jgi:hypothetical protein
MRRGGWLRGAGALAGIAAGCGGCAGPLAHGEAAFRAGDYPEAKRELNALQAESRTWPRDRRAEYALYRGLTLGALGDVVRAGVWLEQAWAIEARHPGSLSVDDAARLETAVEAAGLR